MADPCGCSSSSSSSGGSSSTSSTPDRRYSTKKTDTFGIREGEFIRLTDLMTRGDPHEGNVPQKCSELFRSYIVQ
jgi:hypothetical protein